MSHTIVGRIFWKEARVQRAFWVWILGLGLFIQLVPAFLGRTYYRGALEIHWFYSVNVIIACCFAVGSTAIAFAGETENRTKSLFQRMPVRNGELLVGKLGWCLLGSYALASILALTASVLGGSSPAAASNIVGIGFEPGTSEFWLSLFLPIPFLLMGLLGSLAFRDVLTTVAIAGAATVVLLGITNRDLITLPGPVSHVVLGVVLAGVAVMDALLVPYWLRDALALSALPRVPRLTRKSTGPGHSTLSVRSSVAWRRATSSLVWKELRQAAPFTLTMAALGGVLLFVIHILRQESPRPFQDGWGSFVQVFLPVFPLPFGIAAARSDRRDAAYRLLARIGVSPNRYWLTKHTLWLGLAIATTLCLLGFDQFLLRLFPTPGFAPETLWRGAERAALETFVTPGFAADGSAGFAMTLGVILFDVLLLYSLGVLLSLLIPSTMTALVLGLITFVALVPAWIAVTMFGVPFWWTIGLLPLIFLFTGWLRTEDWLIDRNSLPAWSRVAASLAVPLVGICCGIAAFRVVQVPAVSLPLELQTARLPEFGGNRSQNSLFVDALRSINGIPSRETKSGEPATDDWFLTDPQIRDWVETNERARQLALEAAKREPGDFGGVGPTRTPERGTLVVENGELDTHVRFLTTLLLYSARKAEAANDLEGALRDYVATARLGDDLARSYRLSSPWQFPPTRMLAMNAMGRWAAHAKQTPELIKRAIGLFQRFEEDAPLYSRYTLRDWRLERERFESYVWRGENPRVENRVAAETGFVRWCLPWELLRLQRLQDAMFYQSLDEMQLVERELRDRGFVDSALITANRQHLPWKWEYTTLGVPNDCPSGANWMATPEWKVNRTAAVRLHLLVWAVTDYRREHHKLPANLSELVPAYFAWLPIDPWTGRDFLYVPKGIPAHLSGNEGDRLEPNEPFIASAGALDCHFVLNHPGVGTSPVQVITREGRDLNTGPQFGPLQFPGPVVAIPILAEPRKVPKPADKSPAKPAEKRPATQLDEPRFERADRRRSRPAETPLQRNDSAGRGSNLGGAKRMTHGSVHLRAS